MNQPDALAASTQDPTTASSQDRGETTAAPSTANAAGEQPAAPPSEPANVRPAGSALGEHSDEETEIATLAYQYYEEEGRPHGRSQDHWARAGKAVRGRHVLGAEGSR